MIALLKINDLTPQSNTTTVATTATSILCSARTMAVGIPSFRRHHGALLLFFLDITLILVATTHHATILSKQQ
jgi:hypothetical protein